MPNFIPLYRACRPLVRAWGLARNGVTLGVRVVLTDAEDRIALVRHSYEAGWHFPGGGVDHGETIEQAARREAQEEAGCDPDALSLIGMFNNGRVHPRDHVALFRASAWTEHPVRPGLEIADRGWFALDEARTLASPGTGRRLAELYDGADRDLYW